MSPSLFQRARRLIDPWLGSDEEEILQDFVEGSKGAKALWSMGSKGERSLPGLNEIVMGFSGELERSLEW